MLFSFMISLTGNSFILLILQYGYCCILKLLERNTLGLTQQHVKLRNNRQGKEVTWNYICYLGTIFENSCLLVAISLCLSNAGAAEMYVRLGVSLYCWPGETPALKTRLTWNLIRLVSLNYFWCRMGFLYRVPPITANKKENTNAMLLAVE